jgi:pSer/pThr/pTyr-binding forkhead associated (FHA) protein/ribosomal protein L40E
MIVCPNCNHQNPDAAVQCEACYTPLPAMMNCPSCGALVQTDASFCGQCGFNLQSSSSPSPSFGAPVPAVSTPDFDFMVPSPDPLVQPEPVQPEPLVASLGGSLDPGSPELVGNSPVAAAPIPPSATPTPVVPSPSSSQTQLQTQIVRLLHVQTNTPIELPNTLAVIHIGKPNDRIPPDIDVSGFPHSEIVSRIHADIRVEGDIYYIEDVSSSNGTYINNAPLPAGNRHRLRPGDRIALGKGDKVTFLFQIS